jgi:hypothetical protein
MTTFNPVEQAAKVRSRLWLHLSGSSVPSDLEPAIEDLFRLGRGDLRRLAAASLALQSETAEALVAVERLLRELPASALRREVELVGVVRTPVMWERTIMRQVALSDPSRFVCRPPERQYDTPLAQLLVLALRRFVALVDTAGLPVRAPPGAGARLADLRRDALLHLAHRKLHDVTAVRRLPDRVLASLRRHSLTGPVLEFNRRATEVLEDFSPAAIRKIVSEALLVPSKPDVLFELVVGFALLDAFRDHGYSLQRLALVPGRTPFARLWEGTREARLYWHHPLWSIHGDPSQSVYRRILADAGMTLRHLIPDFLIVQDEPRRVLIVEVKLTEREAYRADRRGILDAMAYLHDAGGELRGLPEPHALVVAWNAEGRPRQGRVLVADQDQIGAAVALILRQWGFEPRSRRNGSG